MTSLTGENVSTVKQSVPTYNQNSKMELMKEFSSQKFSRHTLIQPDIAYEFTRDPALLHQYYHMREEMFSNVWGLKHFSGKQDAFDACSEIMVARKGRQCIGGGRLTISSPGQRRLLPMEQNGLSLAELFPQLDMQDTAYGEFSRLAILPEFRGGTIFPEISRRFIRKAISEGVEYAFNIAPVPLARSYRQAVQLFGLKWDICHDITVPQCDEYEGIRMIISVMDLSLHVRSYRASRKNKRVAAQDLMAD